MEGEASTPILLEHVSVESTPESLVLDISFTESTPRLAADWANAFAEAYLSYRRDRAEEALAEVKADEAMKRSVVDCSDAVTTPAEATVTV